MANPTLSQVHIDRAMTRISIAHRNTSYIADQLFPNLPVNNQSDKYFVFDKSSWFRDEAGPRAPGTKGPQGDYSISSSAYSAQPIAMTKLVPDEILQNADAPLQIQTAATEFATDKVMLSVERDVAGFVFDAGSWAASANPTSQWNLDSSEPLVDVETGREAIVKAVGREPNVFVMGREVWTKLKNHPDLLDRIKHTQRGIMTIELLAALFEVEKLLVGKAVVDTAEEGETSSRGFVWGKSAALLYVAPTPAIMTPSAGYVFTWKRRQVERFRREEEKSTAYRAEQHYDAKVVSPDAGYELKAVVA